MSSAAAWSYTATATLWARQSRDGFTGELKFAAPVTFACDYKSEARTLTDSNGREFVSRNTLFTESGDVKRGDYVLIGESTATDPTRVAGAEEVKDVLRDADTFQRRRDDYRVMT
jgi:hypothetical protein